MQSRVCTDNCIRGRVCQTSSVQKESETVTGRPSTKDKSIEQPVATTDVKEADDKSVQVNEQMATRKAIAASKEKLNNNPNTMETMRHKVSCNMLNAFYCVPILHFCSCMLSTVRQAGDLDEKERTQSPMSWPGSAQWIVHIPLITYAVA